MTDDEILAEAEHIKAKRLSQRRLDSFERKECVMIRWDNVGVNIGESYTGITVSAESVRDVVHSHFGRLIGDAEGEVE